MIRTRTWRAATAAVAAAGLIMLFGGPATAQLPDLPFPGDDEDEGDDADALPDALTEPGAFIGCAGATGLQVRVGLPEELDGLNALLEPLGLSSPTGRFGAFCPTDFTNDVGFGIYLDLARTQAELWRAAAGEEATPLAEALATNLILENAPCTGLGSAALPDEDTPVLRIELADVNCEESGIEALAEAKIAGVFLNVGNLLDIIGAEALYEAFQELLDGLNESLLAPINEGIAELCDGLGGGLGDLPGPIGGIGEVLLDCEEFLELRLENFLSPEVPVLQLDVLESTSRVTHGSVEAFASAELAGLQLLGLVCVEGSEPGVPLLYSSTATTDGTTATAEAVSTDVTTRLCDNAPLLQILDVDGLFGVIEIGGVSLGDILGEELDPLKEGIEELLRTLATEVAAERDPDIEQVDGAAALAATPPFVIADVAPFSQLPGFEDTPLADISVSVAGLETFAAVNAVPEDEEVVPPPPPPAAPPRDDLPVTGTGIFALLGLSALGAGAILRRRMSV